METSPVTDEAATGRELPEALDTAQPESAETGPWSVRRILVALDASAHSHDVLTTAVSLAAQLKSELHGLFVEDINVVRLSELPFAREIRYGETASRAVEQNDLLRRLRARATILRHELEELTTENKVSSTFRVVRGRVDSELLSAAVEADLLALGRLGHTVAQRARLGSAARAAVARAASAVLLVKSGVEGGPVIVLYDGSPAAGRALALAASVAGEANELRVLAWGPDDETAAGRRHEASHLLEAAPGRVQFQHLAGDDPARLAAWVARQHGSLLILVAGDDRWPAGTLDLLLEEAEQHLLLLR